jgi:hypothetical protein
MRGVLPHSASLVAGRKCSAEIVSFSARPSRDSVKYAVAGIVDPASLTSEEPQVAHRFLCGLPLLSLRVRTLVRLVAHGGHLPTALVAGLTQSLHDPGLRRLTVAELTILGDRTLREPLLHAKAILPLLPLPLSVGPRVLLFTVGLS